MVINVKSKTFWSGVAMIGFGVVQVVKGNQVEGIQSILTGLGLIFLRDAIGNVEKKID